MRRRMNFKTTLCAYWVSMNSDAIDQIEKQDMKGFFLSLKKKNLNLGAPRREDHSKTSGSEERENASWKGPNSGS